jgi:hypothetical protein
MVAKATIFLRQFSVCFPSKKQTQKSPFRRREKIPSPETFME